MSGWIKLHRSIQRNWVFDNDQYFKAWVVILMEVNHEKKGFVFSGTPVICNRGQSAYSIKNWCKMFGKGWSVQKVRTFFKHLTNDGMIIVEEVKRITTKITVCNYDTYQSQQQTANKPITNVQQTDNKPLTTTKELKSLELKNNTDDLFPQEITNVDKKSKNDIYTNWDKDRLWDEIIKSNDNRAKGHGKGYSREYLEYFFHDMTAPTKKGNLKFQERDSFSVGGLLSNWAKQGYYKGGNPYAE